MFLFFFFFCLWLLIWWQSLPLTYTPEHRLGSGFGFGNVSILMHARWLQIGLRVRSFLVPPFVRLLYGLWRRLLPFCLIPLACTRFLLRDSIRRGCLCLFVCLFIYVRVLFATSHHDEECRTYCFRPEKKIELVARPFSKEVPNRVFFLSPFSMFLLYVSHAVSLFSLPLRAYL